MPKPLSTSFLQVYGSVADELIRRIGDPMAVQAGPPVSSDIEPAGDTERVKAWNARRPEATDAAMGQLATQKYAEHRAQGMDAQKAIDATAEDLTHFRYGQRLHLYTYGQVDSRAQVAEAKRIAQLAARESTPDPLPAPPAMPSAGLTNLAMMPAGVPNPALPEAPPSPMAPPAAVPEAQPAPTATPPPPAVPGGY